VAVELSSKLPSGHVEVRLAGQEPELVFVDSTGESAGSTSGEELSARISLRLPESLKLAVEKAADREGVSTNAWLVRAIARATESRPVHVSGKRLSGYAQS
jgi:predicted HicB family RNase H-like nuclease